MPRPPAVQLVNSLIDLPPGRALDLACGDGRHSRWLLERGWEVTAVDIVKPEIFGATCFQADLERHEFPIETDAWDLIVCWLYWQPDLLPAISNGVRKCGYAALAGKTNGRFATSLDRYRAAFDDWAEMSGGVIADADSEKSWAYFIAMRLEDAID
jgi:SAM-dependent methyltransferase